MMDEHNSKLIRYLTGEMPDSEKMELKRLLANDEELRAELRQLWYLRTGMSLSHAISEGHIEIDELVTYVSNRQELDTERLLIINSHLKECEQCKEEDSMASESFAAVSSITGKGQESFGQRLLRTLFESRITLRPVYGLLAVLVMFIPYYFSNQQRDTGSYVAAIELVERAVRGQSAVTSVSLADDIYLVKLKFALPVRTDRTYELQLLDSHSNLMLTLHNKPAQDVFTVDVPRSQLPTGSYLIRVIELDGNSSETERFELAFDIQNSR
jgi:hypothetical protein